MTIILTDKDIDDITMSLLMRINYIETGNIALGAGDAAARGLKVNAIDEVQQRTVARLRSLYNEMIGYNGGSINLENQ